LKRCSWDVGEVSIVNLLLTAEVTLDQAASNIWNANDQLYVAVDMGMYRFERRKYAQY